MTLPGAALEDWLRERYFDAEIDISSSGVAPYSVPELREILGMSLEEFDQVTFTDSRSLGAPELREAIAARWGDGHGEKVVVANGSSEAAFLVMNAVLEPGDTVVVADPAYHALRGTAESLGCRIVCWALRPEDGFRPDLDQLRALVTPGTRMVVVNFPHNPTGVSVSPAEQEALVSVAESAGACLVWDAAFADLTYDVPPLPDATLLYDRAVTFGTLSKGYGLPGLRAGWCIGPPQIVNACAAIRDYTSLALSPLVELVAVRAVCGAGQLLAPRLAQARGNLAVTAEWASGNAGHLAWARPAGGVTAFPRLRRLAHTDAFCDRLLREHGVLLVPGSCFGYPQHVRLGFGGPAAELKEGLGRVSALLDAIHPQAGGRQGPGD